ncbi:hypothetical protein M9H77_12968 [Catharanthus roseus]|uniref:Uncharacterized protein n=1 Tax=Catharanthus roseus TaxID=4058 RepID=A0ACC0BIU5_CATRO|nr:hypothetical protein M9H77_12968 [Catharanthus roseus]
MRINIPKTAKKTPKKLSKAGMGPIKCKNCGLTGHNKRTCGVGSSSSGQRNNERNQAEFVPNNMNKCTSCGEMGHNSVTNMDVNQGDQQESASVNHKTSPEYNMLLSMFVDQEQQQEGVPLNDQRSQFHYGRACIRRRNVRGRITSSLNRDNMESHSR